MPPLWLCKSKEYYIVWESVGSLFFTSMQCACTTLWFAASPACNIFPHYLKNGKDFRRKKKLLNTKFVFLIFSTTFVRSTSHSKENLALRSKMYIGLHVMYSLFLSDFNETWISSTGFQKILIYQISLTFRHRASSI